MWVNSVLVVEINLIKLNNRCYWNACLNVIVNNICGKEYRVNNTLLRRYIDTYCKVWNEYLVSISVVCVRKRTESIVLVGSSTECTSYSRIFLFGSKVCWYFCFLIYSCVLTLHPGIDVCIFSHQVYKNLFWMIFYFGGVI